MATSRVKTNLFLTFEIAAKWQYVCYTQRSHRPISLNQPKTGGTSGPTEFKIKKNLLAVRTILLGGEPTPHTLGVNMHHLDYTTLHCTTILHKLAVGAILLGREPPPLVC